MPFIQVKNTCGSGRLNFGNFIVRIICRLDFGVWKRKRILKCKNENMQGFCQKSNFSNFTFWKITRFRVTALAIIFADKRG